MQTAAVIPALNEEASLPLVLAALAEAGIERVVVADNGSTDRTAELARAAGATVVHQPARGYGSACLAGFSHLERDPPDVVVILDADHSVYLEDLPALLGPIQRGEADMVLGDRTRLAEPGSLTPQQKHGNLLATNLIRLVTGHRYGDMGPFRALRWSSLVALEMEDPTWGWNVEMQIKAVKRGLRVREVDVRYRDRHAGESKISGSLRGSLKAGTKILWATWRYRRG